MFLPIVFLVKHPRNEVASKERDSSLEHVAEVKSKKLLDIDDEGKCVNATKIVPLDVLLEMLSPWLLDPSHFNSTTMAT